MEITELLSRWNSPEGHPYKGCLIDWSEYEADPTFHDFPQCGRGLWDRV